MNKQCNYIKTLWLIFTWMSYSYASINSSTNTTADFQLSAFQELLTVPSVPYNQLKFTYFISPDYARTGATGTGSVTSTEGFAVLSSGLGSTGSANLRSKNRLIYNPGQGSVAMVSAIFSTGVANNSQIIGIGNAEDGFFFGYTGTQFGILWRTNSSETPVETWIPQTGWNVDPMNGTGPSQMVLDPTKGNVYKIQYQWLGFGAINFYVENPTGHMQLVHQIKHANSNTLTTIRNPSLQLRADVANFGNTGTNVQLKSSAMVGFSEGNPGSSLNVRNSISRQNVSISTLDPNLTHVLTMHNKQTFQSRTNQVMVFPDTLSILTSTNTNRDGLFYVYLNPTFSNTGTFTDVNTNNSVMEYSTNSVVSSDGQLLGLIYTQNIEHLFISLLDKNVVLVPDDYLTILAAQAVSLGTLVVSLSMSWTEHF